MSWTKRIQHPSELMKKGDKIDVKILRIDHENRRISLGFKQLQNDPWPDISKKYSMGTDCLGTIMRVLDRGVTVELDGDVEGFVPTHQLGKTDLDNPSDAFSEGDQIPLQVIEFDRQAHKIVLSVSAYYKKREKAELEQFLAKHPTRTVMIEETLGPAADDIKNDKPAVADVSTRDVEEQSETGTVAGPDEPGEIETPAGEEEPEKTEEPELPEDTASEIATEETPVDEESEKGEISPEDSDKV
jgi:small subunit ribosomal protein S1